MAVVNTKRTTTKLDAKAKRKASKQTDSASQKKEKKVNVFHQRLATLTYSQACRLLGDNGA